MVRTLYPKQSKQYMPLVFSAFFFTIVFFFFFCYSFWFFIETNQRRTSRSNVVNNKLPTLCTDSFPNNHPFVVWPYVDSAEESIKIHDDGSDSVSITEAPSRLLSNESQIPTLLWVRARILCGRICGQRRKNVVPFLWRTFGVHNEAP